MKNSVRIFICELMFLYSISLYADHRFFPANSIRCANVTTERTNEYDPINNKYKTKYIYYHYETGNDTIVDGKPCVMLWKYCSETPEEEKELRFLCEENGLISYKYPLAEGGYSDWTILFEFPKGGWIEGESYIDGYFYGEPSSAKAIVSTYTLLNGEEIQTNFGRLLYGIGYNDWPFFEYREYTNGASKNLRPFNIYRNDTLLWGEPLKHEPIFPAHGIRCTNMVTNPNDNSVRYYNLYTGGDTIVDGRKCVQLWEYYTDIEQEYTCQTLKYHLLHEDYGKVYIKYYAEGEWILLYDFTEFEWKEGDCLLMPESNSTPVAIESLDTITLNDGTIRQVAKYGHGELIYGMGYAGAPFFEALTSLGVEKDELRTPVNFYCYDQLLWGKELPKRHELRFFPANAVYATNRYYNARYDENHNPIDNAGEITYNVWTGNDTIVDGRESVVLWHNKAGYTQRYGVIYEDHTGLVYINYLQGDKSDWLFLYDFTPRNWKAGDMMHVSYDDGCDMYEKVYEVSTIELQNGGTTQLTDLLIYGIGYYYEPFLSPIEITSGCSGHTIPINFYRNGVLLWGKEEQSGNSVATPMVNKAPTPYYDLQGRPVANPTRGIYIKDGKKVVIK